MGILNRLLGSLRKSGLDRDLADEQRHHLELAALDLETQGVDAVEARRLAAVRYGHRDLDETRKQNVMPWIEDTLRDVRVALRSLRRSPSYTLVVLIALALGIGANTAAYSVISAILLRPLPYPQPERLVFLRTQLADGRKSWANYDDLKDWAKDSQTLSSIAAFVSQTVNLTGAGEPDRLRGGFISSNFFGTLGIAPVAGRAMATAEDAVGGPKVAIASWGLWREKFGGRADFLNSKVLLNGEPYQIVGILPKTFDFPLDRIDVWMPYPAWPAYEHGRRSSINAAAVARLRDGATADAAQQELTARAKALATQYPESNRDRIGVDAKPLQQMLSEDLVPLLTLLGGAVLLALLVACANIGTLTVSRVLARNRELSIHAALGASRMRLARHLFTEQFLLGFGGGALGLLFAYWFTRAAIPAGLFPESMAPRVDWTVTMAALGFAILTGVLTGPLAAASLLFGRRTQIFGNIRVAGENRSANRTRGVLVTASVALSMVLLAGAGLLIRSFNSISGVDPGFDPRNLLTLEYRMPQAKYPTPEQQAEFHRRVASEASAMPGAKSAAVMMALPFSGNGNFAPYTVPGQAPLPKGAEPRAQINRVDPRYFETMSIRLLQGREFGPSDRAGSQRVAILSKSLAERTWPGQNPLGRSIVLLGETATVVGVVADSKHSNLEEESRDKAYVAFAQNPHLFGTLAVRTFGDPMQLARAVRQAVWKVDSEQPVWKVRSMESLLDVSVRDRRQLAALMATFSGFALLLAAIGLYGVISYSVSRRAKELAVRSALGASRQSLVASVMFDGFRRIAVGLAIGLAASYGFATLLRGQLFQVRATDVQPYAAAVVALVLAAFLATLLPARRVASLDLTAVLRQD